MTDKKSPLTPSFAATASKRIPLSSFAPALLRRRILPLASAATALSLVGCASQHVSTTSAAITNQKAVAPSVLTAEDETALRVQSYANDLNVALDKLDAEKLHPHDKKQIAASPTTRPAVADAASAVVTPMANVATITPLADHAAGIPTALGAMTAMSVEKPAPATQPATVITASVSPIVPPVRAVVAAPPVHVEPTLNEAMDVVRKRIAAHPTLNTTLALALLDSAEGKAPNASLASALSAPDQKLLTDLLAALQGMTPISASASLPDRAAPLVDAAKRWQADADLALPKLALASRVDSFGVYTPVEPKFQQGVARTVILYCEVANFVSQLAKDGLYETRLSQQESLITSDGLLVYRPNAEEVEDRSLNQRHDFYLVKKITIPETLAVGKYTLRMNVTDHVGGKIAIVSMPVEIIEK